MLAFQPTTSSVPATRSTCSSGATPSCPCRVPVRPDGKISTPLVEDMVAVGKTPSQLARDIEAVLGEYIRNPQVNIIVTKPERLQPRDSDRAGGLAGFVSLPRRHASAGPRARGRRPDQFAAGNRARTRADGRDGKTGEITRAPEGPPENGAPRRTTSTVRPGDVLVVPESLFLASPAAADSRR